MFVHVKFVDDFGDNSKVNVPCNYIKNFDPEDIDLKKTYEVFWSPDSEETPENYLSESAGYYKALILKCADTEKDLEDLLEKTRIRIPTKRLVKSPQLTSSEDTKPSKRDSNKAMKHLQDKGKAENLKTLLKGKPIKRNLATLFPDREDGSKSDSSLFSDDSDDDVVPKKMLKQSEQVIEDQKSEIKELRGKNKKLKAEKEESEKKLSELKKKYSDLVNLNHEVQKKILSYFEKNKTTPTSSLDHDFIGAHSCVSPVSAFNDPLLETPSTKPPTPSPHTYGSPSPSPTVTGIRPNISSANIDESGMINENLTPDIIQPTDNEEDYSLSKEKLNAVRQQIKRGAQGDSQYAKNLAAAIWPPHVLSTRSVSGRKGNFKGKEAKAKLTPSKLQYLTDLFKKRIFEENPNATVDEVNLRMKNVPTYISQKIATLNRVTN